MLKRLCQLLAAAIVVALGLAPAALAGAGKKPKQPPGCVSAVCVYHESPVPGAGGASGGGKPVPLSKAIAKKLDKKGGPDKAGIRALATINPGVGTHRLQQSSLSSGQVGTPSALGAAFDAGSVPTTLFVALLGTVVLLAAFEGTRRWRRR